MYVNSKENGTVMLKRHSMRNGDISVSIYRFTLPVVMHFVSLLLPDKAKPSKQHRWLRTSPYTRYAALPL